MKKILVPTDFSEIARNAFDFAVQLAKKIDAEILVLHAVEFDHQSFSVSGEMGAANLDFINHNELIKGSRLRLEELLSDVEGVDIITKVAVDDAEDAIEKAIDRYEVDLVVMGSKGAKGLKELLIGSHTEKIIRRVECPVITIKGKTDLSELETIMFATDLHDETIYTANVVKKLQDFLGIQLELLCIRRAYLDLSSDELQKKMRAYIEKTNITECGINLSTADDIEEGILEVAKHINAGIIAMSTHGRKGIMHMLMGSHTENIANHSDKPVMSVKIS